MTLVSRRQLLHRAGTGVAAIGVLSACTQTTAGLTVPTPVPSTGGDHNNNSDHDTPADAPAAQATATKTPREQADEMDAMHEEGVKFFVENAGKDPAFWHNYLEYTMDGDVKVFELTCTEMEWDVADGQMVRAMAYNGVVPGPEIRVTEGDKIRVIVHNEMNQSTAVHWHGVMVPNSMDGVPFITQPPIKPGESFTYEFPIRVGNSGTHMYHSHHNAAEQVTRGLMGAFIIEPRDKSNYPEVVADYNMVLNDSGVGLTINGRSFPYTQPMIHKLGDKIRVRYMNEGLMIHPMHLHGIPQLVIEKDGYPLPQPFWCDTLNIAPGERWDVLVECSEPGAWAYHCHILTHAESAHGMFGMVTALLVQE